MLERISATQAYPTTRCQTQDWVAYRLPSQVGECHFERHLLEPGFSLVRSRYMPHADLVETSHQETEQRTLVITFGLRGESEYCDQHGNRVTFKAGQTSINSFRDGRGERRFSARQDVQQLRLIVSENTLADYIGEERCAQLLCEPHAPNSGLRQLTFHANTSSSRAHIQALTQLKEINNPDKLGLRIHALSLLSEQLQILTPATATQRRLSDPEQDKLEQARQIIFTQMAQPLTNHYLCSCVGLSESRLKDGFRRYFGVTPRRCLLEARMHKAWQLLEAGRQVAEAAYSVGYSHPSNFSTAFSQFFGRTPKSVSGTRN